MMFEVITNSPEETISFGAKLSSKLRPGDIVLLYGNLGAGKTTLTTGICKYFSISFAKSPTFTIVNIYNGDFPICHIDLYRIDSKNDLIFGEISEYFNSGDYITIVEWAEKLPDDFADDKLIAVRLERLSEEKRKITVEGLNESDYR